ncbi:MAG: hypothetical protein ABR990_12760 [Terracidiphilus sp.]|jgi:hypothetical protein
MSAQTAMSLMSVAEFALWAVLGFLFWTKKLQRRFPAMGAYLALRVASMPVLLFFLYGRSQHWFNGLCSPIYFFAYWAIFIASAVFLYFICLEVFRSTLSAFPGLMKFGIVIFRWAVLASVIVSFSTISFSHRGVLLIPSVAYGMMRSVSIVELCLLGFLCLGMNALRLSPRDMAFGIALGLGIISANDFVQSLVDSAYSSLTAPWQFVYESAILATLGMWVAYCALPEPARQPLMVPANSIIFRWNEIATALGHTGTQVAVQPAGGFSLTEAENAVEEVLTQDLKSRASAT